MKATINRIAMLWAVLLPILASAQTFPSYLQDKRKLPDGHPKIVQQNFAEGEPIPNFQAPPAAFPICVFDEMNTKHAQEHPSFGEALKHYLETELPLLSASSADKSMVEPLLTISVVVHIIHNGEPIGQGQNLSNAHVQAQIDILNQDFSALNSQFYNTPSQWMGIAGFPNIQFCLANKKPDGSPTNGIDRQMMTVTGTSWNNNNINSTIKPAIRWDPLRYFNIYVLPIPGTTAQGGVVGYSNYPIVGQIGGNSDGVVIDYRWFGAPGFPASGYRPLTHETGHYLGLPHPFNGSSCNLDDGIGDTPNIEISTRDLATLNCASSFPNGPSSCGNEHLYVNYMDYVTENCYTSFTAGQVNVMRAVLNGTSSGFGYGSRNGLIQNAPQQCSIPGIDAGITRIVSPANIACTSGQITPVVTLRNFGTANLTTANIFYRINNNAPVNLAWQGSLFAGQNLDVNLAPFAPTEGGYTLTVWTSQPNGLADQRPANDTTAANRFTYIATAAPMFEDFENESAFPTSEGIFQLNVSNDVFVWQMTDEASGFGQGGTSVMFDNYHDFNGTNPGGTIDALITRHFDFTNLTNAMLKFDVGYAPYIEDIGDSLLVLVATNCSQNFNQIVYKNGGMNLATAPITTDPFTPTASQWRTEIVDLSAYDGVSDVTIALVNLSAFGNRLFIDNIGIGRNCNLLTATAVNLQPDDCSAACNGAATIQVANQNGGAHYRWEGFPNTFDQATNTGLCAGANTVTVTDGIGCTKQVLLQIAQQQAPLLATTSTNVSVYNGTNGTATVIVSNAPAPYSYVWSNGFQEPNTNTTSSTANGLAVGSYTVTVTAGNGCTATATVVVGSVCTGFTVSTNIQAQPCSNSSNGVVTAEAQSGASPITFSWSNGQNSATLNNLGAGNYSVTATDANGCPATTTINLMAYPAISTTATATHQTVLGVNDGTVTVNASGGGGSFVYLWNNGMITNPITGLAPGTYSVTVTDANGCTTTASSTVNSVNCGAFTASLNVVNNPCFGANDGTATAVTTGGNLPVTYSWSNGATTASVQNLSVGPISVSITDGLGCLVELSGNVVQPSQLSANLTATNETMPDADDGTAAVSPSGGTSPYSVLWSNGATSLIINNLAPGTYAVTITDANGCTSTGQATVLATTCFIGLHLVATPNPCPDLASGSATVTVQSGGTGPFTYNWSNGGTTATISNLVSNNYLVTVTDAGGCTTTGQVAVNSNDTTPPTLVLQTAVIVLLDANGTATLNPTQLVASSSDNCSMVFLDASPSVVGCQDIGTVQVTITATDNSGNQTVVSTEILVKDQSPPAITCPSNINVTGCGFVDYPAPAASDDCSPPSSISLTLVNGFNSGQVFPVGTTEVTWSAQDESGNEATCSFLVTVDYDLSVDALSTSPSCYGASNGSIILEIQGGEQPYQATWNQAGAPNNLAAGSYTYTVTDNNGCSIIETILLTEPGVLSVQIQDIIPATAGQSNGQIDFQVNGGTAPFTLTWLLNGSPMPDFDPLAAAAGSYQLKVEDANGCLHLSGLIVVGSISSAHEATLEQQVQVSPNPSNGIFYLETKGVLTVAAFSVYDGTGRIVLASKKLPKSTSTEVIDLQQFTTGVYWVKIVVGEGIVWKKIVKI